MSGRRWTESILLVAGLIAVDVWIWSHASTAIFQSLENRDFDRELAGVPAATRQPPVAGSPTHRSDSRLGRLTIPRLHLQAMVREGTDEGTLSLALGHIPSTAWPGENGNVGVAGHRDTLFRGLRDVRKNDLIVFETLGGRYTYRVETAEIVKPQNVSVLKEGRFPQLTLVTCYPFQYVGNAPDRFIVKARQIGSAERQASTAEVQKAVSVRKVRRLDIAGRSRTESGRKYRNRFSY